MKFRITLRTYKTNLINLTLEQFLKVQEIEENIIKVTFLPTKIKRFCVLRSPHVDKNSREHLEVRLYKCIIDINYSNINLLKLLFNIELPVGLFSHLKIFVD